VSGVIAAVGNNYEGICGVSWHSKIMPLRVAYTTDDVAPAIEYARVKDAHIINMSFGNNREGGEYGDGVVKDALDAAYEDGLLLVASAGNDNADINHYPAALYNVIATASTNALDWRASFSTYGQWVDLAAPGRFVLTTTLEGSYDKASGTSFSAPYVAGLAALLLSYNPSLTNIEVRAIIENTTDYLETDYYIGTGRVNASNALSAPGPVYPLGEIVSPLDKDTLYRCDEQLSFSFLAYGDHYTLEYKGDGDVWTSLAQGIPEEEMQDDGLIHLSLENPGFDYYGSHTLRLTTDEDAYQHRDSKLLYISTSTWYTESVENCRGISPSLAIDSSDNFHISYYDDINKNLKYAYYDGTWHTETVDSDYDVGMHSSIALDSNNNPHISYYNNTRDDLKYAHYDGAWHIETVNSVGMVGSTSSLALDSSNNPHISYFDNYNYDLKYAYYDGAWHIETVDSVGMVGCISSLALDSSNNPHISYYDDDRGNLKYAHYDGTWQIETVDSDYDVGRDSSLALDSSNNPHISYYDDARGNLKYAHYDGGWQIETVDSDYDVGWYPTLALDSSNNPHISYYDNTNGDLKYAHYDGTWHIETIDKHVTFSSISYKYSGRSLALDSNGEPWSSYPGQDNFIRYAWRVADFDCDEILDSNDNCPNVPNFDQEDGDEDGIGDACDSCPTDYNPGQEDNDVDGLGDVCDDCTDTDGDGYGNPGFPNNTCDEDNCPNHPNGPVLGTCVREIGEIIVSTGVTCTLVGEECEGGETCQMDQGDWNNNGFGDACDCNADFDGDGKVFPSDAMVLLGEWKRKDCSGEDPCQADIDGNGKVFPSDAMILLGEWKRKDCPVIE